MGDDGRWLSGQNTIDAEETDRVLSTQFIQRRNLLVKHLHYYRQNGAITEQLMIFLSNGDEVTKW